MTDFFLALMLPGAGDELQGIKKGLVELADMIAINKADGDNIKRANLAAAEYRAALHILTPRSAHWQPPVVTYSALTGAGIAELWGKVVEHRTAMQASGEFAARGASSRCRWMWTMLEDRWKARLRADPAIRAKVTRHRSRGRRRPDHAVARRRPDRGMAALSARLAHPDHRLRPVSRRAVQSDAGAGGAAAAGCAARPSTSRADRPRLSGELSRGRSRVAGAARAASARRAADVRARRAHAPSADRDPRPQCRHDAVAGRRASRCAPPRSNPAPRRSTFGPHCAQTAARRAGHRDRRADLARCRALSVQLSELARASRRRATPHGPRLAAFVHVPLVPRAGDVRRPSHARAITAEQLVDAGEAMLLELVRRGPPSPAEASVSRTGTSALSLQAKRGRLTLPARSLRA